MPKNNLVLKAFSWAVSITSLFVITLCAGLVSLIVGDWIMMKTENLILSWGVGFFVFFGFLSLHRNPSECKRKPYTQSEQRDSDQDVAPDVHETG